MRNIINHENLTPLAAALKVRWSETLLCGNIVVYLHFVLSLMAYFWLEVLCEFMGGWVSEWVILHPVSRAFVCRLECRGEKEGLPESRQAFEVIEAWNSRLLNLVLSHKTGFQNVCTVDWETNGHNCACCTKDTDISPGFESVSQQQVARCSAKILFSSCRIFPNIAKVETDGEKNTLLAGWCATEPLSINNDVQLHFSALALYSTCKPHSFYPRLHVTVNRLLTPPFNFP